MVDGIAAMAENAGALRDVFWVPWHTRHVASTNVFPEAGSPTCWPKAMAMLARRSGALHANERHPGLNPEYSARFPLLPACTHSRLSPGRRSFAGTQLRLR